VLAALGALVWSVRSNEPPASSAPVAAGPRGSAPLPRTRIRVGVFYGPAMRDHEAFLSRIGSAPGP
jgi:hypothetical protein